MSFLRNNENIFFTGKYEISNENIKGNIDSIKCELDINPIGLNILTIQWYYVNEKDSDEKFLYEDYTIFSYKSDLETKIGEIRFQGLYSNPNSENGITTSLVERFNIVFKNGIFVNISSIAIDFFSPTRIMYFLDKN